MPSGDLTHALIDRKFMRYFTPNPLEDTNNTHGVNSGLSNPNITKTVHNLLSPWNRSCRWLEQNITSKTNFAIT